MKKNLQDMFSQSRGFGEHKDFAVFLLKKLVEFLDKNNIEYYLISGTLLGFCRHNDFIPWDDDIDIIVSEDFLKVFSKLHNEKCNEEICEYKIYTQVEKYVYKFFIDKKFINHNNKYYWPFIDIFIFYEKDNKMNFFRKDWEKKNFYPPKNVLFNNIEVKIPREPSYFLEINYGKNYMDKYISSSWNHKLEKYHNNNAVISHDDYNKFINNNS